MCLILSNLFIVRKVILPHFPLMPPPRSCCFLYLSISWWEAEAFRRCFSSRLSQIQCCISVFTHSLFWTFWVWKLLADQDFPTLLKFISSALFHWLFLLSPLTEPPPSPLFSLSLRETRFHTLAQTKLTLLKISCPRLLSTRVIDLSHHTQVVFFLGWLIILLNQAS